MKEIYTIGYASCQPEEMVRVLQKHGIRCLVDVRSSPYSSYYTQYNKEPFSELLKKNQILYRNYAKEFGARQEDPQYYTPEGYLDFSLYTQSESFLNGVKKLEDGIALGYSFVLMCAEKDPLTCHRAIMIGKALKDRGFLVKHLIGEEAVETQEEMEQRALGDQLSFFPEEDRIEELYRKQNEKIGYRLDAGREGAA